ncbi:hypothetical protein AC529_04760 [Thermobifida cellulosilytica TB100]|uniref:Uncharacterized protein n=2 Tax=Thermobifida cellulosilytica TaxID=144786 RepID=A0A147KKF0_THECS|nr:hypothetical protein AC529_04760 [Thermobifida cellulosilytica TB100]
MGVMTATDPLLGALARLRSDFPLWEITYDPNRETWRRWRAWRHAPLTEVEAQQYRRREIVAPTMDRLLADLGAEQRAQDVLRAVSRRS